MKKIYIQDTSGQGFNAGSKARNDCDRILEGFGYEPVLLELSDEKRKRRWQKRLNPWKAAFRLRSCGDCFLQYPYYNLWYQGKDYRRMLQHYHGRLTCLIHDIPGLRDGGEIEPELSYVLDRADKVIAHTPKMKEILTGKTGVDPDKIGVLYLFDYLTDSASDEPDPDGKEIIYAGNLDKSIFLRDLDRLSGNTVFNLYGLPSANVKESSRCSYKGKFHPDDVSFIKGNWGLVWDGDSIDTCQGPFGEYLRFNSSHKISLYLAARKPVIIWEESSLKDFITGNHLGIAVSSLGEIDRKISTLTDEERCLMVRNVTGISSELRSGGFLKRWL